MSQSWEHDDGLRVTTRRARIIKVDDEKSQQRVDIKGLKNEKPEKVWRPQDFGFTSVPPEDSDGVMIQMGSRSDRTLYLDAGHEKYRPRKKDGLEQGDTAIFNHNGDIVKVLKKSVDVVHKELINIKIGKGYAAGSGDGGEAESESDEETTVSLVIKKGDSITVTFDDSSVKLESGKATIKSRVIVCDAAEKVLLGGPDAVVPVGLCGGGCATKVFAI